MREIVRELVDRLHAVINADDDQLNTDAGMPAWSDAVWADMAAGEYRRRRLRDKIYGTPSLFGEPSWDILLDLFMRQMRGETTSVTSACLASCVPPTTALRWLQVLEKHNIVQKVDDPYDRRRVYLQMTHNGIVQVKQYLAQSTRAIRTRLQY